MGLYSSHVNRAALVFLAAMLVLAGASSVQAEERVLEIGKWYPSLESGLTLTQSTYTDNWAGGDKGSIVWTFITNATLENQLHQKVNWNSILKLAYGQTHQQKADTDGQRYWEKPEKSTDLIDLETVFRFTLGGWVDPFAAGRLETQFQDASDADGRNLSLNPIRVKLTAGVARQFINEEDRSLLSRLGFAVRQTSRKLFTEPAPDETTKSESSTDGGLEWVTDYKTKVLSDRVAWTSKLTVYQPLFYSSKEDFDDLTPEQLGTIDPDIADYTMVTDADWENIFTTQITKLLSVNLYLRFIYDKYDNSVPPVFDAEGNLTETSKSALAAAIRKGVQIKETLALGITYRFL